VALLERPSIPARKEGNRLGGAIGGHPGNDQRACALQVDAPLRPKRWGLDEEDGIAVARGPLDDGRRNDR